MPALLAVLEEARCWMLDAADHSHNVSQHALPVPASWEWVTVAVWTCLRSCGGANNQTWIEQPVSVAYETY